MIESLILIKSLGNNDVPKYKRIFNAFKESIEINFFNLEIAYLI